MKEIIQCAAVLLLIAMVPACATPKGVSSKSSMQVLEATQQTTLPGRPEMAPYTDFRFRVVWKSQERPQAIYWRPDGKQWILTQIEAGDIRLGDTAILTVRSPWRDIRPVSSKVKEKPALSLYYQHKTSAGYKWMYTPVTVKKLPDIVMP